MRLLALAAAVLSATLFASAGSAHAQSTAASAFSIPPTTDIWRHLLEIVFPGVGPLGGSATQGSNALAGASGAFIAVLMMAGSCMMAWHIVAGMVETAHEGTPLGRQYHQIWAPIRVCLGFGMLVPVSGGFCLAQILVLTIACWSGSLGNSLWSAYLDGLTTPAISAPSLPATGAIVKEFAGATACYVALSERRGESGLSTLPDVQPAQSNLSTVGGIAVTAGNAWSYLTSWVDGGSQTSAGASNRTLVSWNYGACGTISMPLALNPGGDAVVTAFDNARLIAFTNLAGSLSATAKDFVRVTTSGSSTPASESSGAAAATSGIAQAKSALDSALTIAAGGLVKDGNSGSLASFQSAAKSAGWVSAASYYPVLARLQTRVQQLADTMPSLSVDAAADDADSESASIIAGLRKPVTGTIWLFNKAYDSAEYGWSSSVPDLSSDVKAGSDGASAVSIAGILNWLFAGAFSTIDGYVTGVSASADSAAPLQQMATFGSKLLSALTAVFFVGVVALLAGGGSTFAAVLGAGGVIGYVVKLAVALGGGLLIVGITHAYVLPMLPFIQMLFATVSILVLVAEAVFAAPLWALMHIRMDGQEFVGPEQRAGYQILFNLFLRIPLTMLALFLSLSVFQAGIWLMSITFYPAMLSATADNSAGLIGSVAMLLLVSFLHWHLAIRSFGLITTLPDRVSRWFGAAPESTGDDRHAADVKALVIGGAQGAARSATPERGRPPAAPPSSPGPGGGVLGVEGGAPGRAVNNAVVAGADADTDGARGTHERSELSVPDAQSAPAAVQQEAGEHHHDAGGKRHG